MSDDDFGLELPNEDAWAWMDDPATAAILAAAGIGLVAILAANFWPADRPKEKNFFIPMGVKTEKRVEKTEKPLQQILEEKRARAELVDRENYIYYVDPRTKEVMKKPKDITDYLSIAGAPIED